MVDPTRARALAFSSAGAGAGADADEDPLRSVSELLLSLTIDAANPGGIYHPWWAKASPETPSSSLLARPAPRIVHGDVDASVRGHQSPVARRCAGIASEY